MDHSHSNRKIRKLLNLHEHINISPQRSHTLSIETCRIHTHSIKVCDLLIHSSHLMLRLCNIRKQVIQTHLIALTKAIESTVTRKFRLKRIGSLPTSCSILIEIIVESHALVKIRTIDCWNNLGLLHIATCHTNNG